MQLSKSEQSIGTLISSFVITLFSMYILFGSIGVADEGLVLSGIGLILLVSIVCGFVFQHRLRRKGRTTEIDYINVGIHRHFLGLFMVFYGLPKLFGNFFDYQLFALDSKLVDVSEFELAWYYFGKNNWQELVSGLLEFIPGLLLFYRRTYYAAALVLLFVTIQVFVLNFFFKIGGITFPAATILLACNVYIIYSKKAEIIQFFRSLNFSNNWQFSKRTGLVLKSLKVAMMLLVAFVVFIKVRPAIAKSDRNVKYEKMVGKYTLEKVVKNGAAYEPTNDSLLFKDLYFEKQSRWNILRKFNDETQAYIVDLNLQNDSIGIYINNGGIGDGPDIIDSTTALRGIYAIRDNQLFIDGIQMSDTLNLIFTKQNLEPKKWLW